MDEEFELEGMAEIVNNIVEIPHKISKTLLKLGTMMYILNKSE